MISALRVIIQYKNNMQSIFAPDRGQLILPHPRVMFVLPRKVEFAAPAHPVWPVTLLRRKITRFLRVYVAYVLVAGLQFCETVCFGEQNIVVMVHEVANFAG